MKISLSMRCCSSRGEVLGLVPEHELAVGKVQQQMAADAVHPEQYQQRKNARYVELIIGIEDQETDPVLRADELADQGAENAEYRGHAQSGEYEGQRVRQLDDAERQPAAGLE